MIFGRIAKMMVRGEIMYVEHWRVTRSILENDLIYLENSVGFKEWATDILELENIYELNRLVHSLNQKEQSREKTVEDSIDVQLYHIERALRTSDQILLTLREAHLKLTNDVAEMKRQHQQHIAALIAELDRCKIELGEEPTGGWDEWAKHQRPVSEETAQKIDDALGIVRK